MDFDDFQSIFWYYNMKLSLSYIKVIQNIGEFSNIQTHIHTIFKNNQHSSESKENHLYFELF